MKETIQQLRILAIQRYLNGEAPGTICKTLGCSKSWFYKWLERFNNDDFNWHQDHSKNPLRKPRATPEDVEQLVRIIRLDRYNHGLFCGAQAILWELEDMQITPLPSIRTINRIIDRLGLTHRRTGKYESKERPYPKLPAMFPNQTQQADLVGPCYLKGPVRFYSLNVVDTMTSRCGIHPTRSISGESITKALWAIWHRLGIPSNIQVDNAATFHGSPKYPRSMGPLIRLCLNHGVEPWFIPVKEPWRNGVVEKFNDHYEQRFLKKVELHSEKELSDESLRYEQRHNNQYRYSKLKGKTPSRVLTESGHSLRFPSTDNAPTYPLKPPKTGRYHVVRLIRSNHKLDVFGELFPVPPELQYEYVVATIDVEKRKLQLYFANALVEEYPYPLK